MGTNPHDKTHVSNLAWILLLILLGRFSILLGIYGTEVETQERNQSFFFRLILNKLTNIMKR